MKGKFITFEGGEGAGKSTQVKLLAEYLRGEGHEVVVTREPGGTPGGEEIRKLLLTHEWDGLTEALLNFAARNEHVKNVIKPALAVGQWVISDRFFDSTFVYQGFAQAVDMNVLHEIKQAVLGDFAPDVTFLLDIEVDKALARATDHNRYEKMGLAFHKKVRDGFLQLANENKRFKVIDASKTSEAVHKNIIKQLS